MSDQDIRFAVWLAVALIWLGACLYRADKDDDGAMILAGFAGVVWPITGLILVGYWLGGKTK